MSAYTLKLSKSLNQKVIHAMKFRQYEKSDLRAIVELFTSVFADSEGENEGVLIGRLASELFQSTSEHDLFNFVADDNGHVIGSIFFTRLNFENDIEVFILAPVAVHTDYQGKGIGQALINYGLTELKGRGISVAITYGDPGFYEKVGFRQISHETIKAPFELSHPEGWLGQSLADNAIEGLAGNCRCVEALANPVYW